LPLLEEAYLLERSRQWGEAISRYQLVLERADLPDSIRPTVFLHLAFAYSMSSQPEEARETLAEVLVDFPGTEHAVAASRMLAYLREITEGTSTVAANDPLERGREAYLRLRFDEAIADFARYIASPESPEREAQARFLKGRAHEESGEYDDAIAEYLSTSRLEIEFWSLQAERRLVMVDEFYSPNLEEAEEVRDALRRRADEAFLETVEAFAAIAEPPQPPSTVPEPERPANPPTVTERREPETPSEAPASADPEELHNEDSAALNAPSPGGFPRDDERETPRERPPLRRIEFEGRLPDTPPPAAVAALQEPASTGVRRPLAQLPESVTVSPVALFARARVRDLAIEIVSAERLSRSTVRAAEEARQLLSSLSGPNDVWARRAERVAQASAERYEREQAIAQEISALTSALEESGVNRGLGSNSAATPSNAALRAEQLGDVRTSSVVIGAVGLGAASVGLGLGNASYQEYLAADRQAEAVALRRETERYQALTIYSGVVAGVSAVIAVVSTAARRAILRDQQARSELISQIRELEGDLGYRGELGLSNPREWGAVE
jgi:hypothetical protein